MTVRMILDSSAAAAYAEGSIHVGELLTELHDEPGVRFAIPVVCWAQANALSDETEVLRLLATHELGSVTPIVAKRWRDLGNLSKMMGSALHAVPFLEVVQSDECYLVTAEPHRYPETDLIIDVG